ncbi:hypothetical protein BGX33_008103 [Mortierella sp. NVP41]|nr:hypothetical protein BGX33_008103 [Mortierella sp. NVP41]
MTTTTKTSSLARRGQPQLPPEVLELIVAHLTRRDLLSVTRVCKSWRESASHQLWKNIDRLPFNLEFLWELPTNGHLTHRLGLIFHRQSKVEGKPAELLAQVLQDTPRLQHLSVELLEWGNTEVFVPVCKAIKQYVSGNLLSLELKGDSYSMWSEAAKDFFPSLTRLTRLEMDALPDENTLEAIISSLPLLTSIAFKGDRSSRASSSHFRSIGFGDIAGRLPLLKEITVHFNKNLTTSGLETFSRCCPRLTRLDLRGCHGFNINGLAAFLQAEPFLTDICLADTNLCDSGLAVLAAPSRAGLLRVLNIRKCNGVRAHGLGQIVAACTNLQDLNFSLCPSVWMEVFGGTWGCLGLLRLNFGGIHGTVPSQDGGVSYIPRLVQIAELEQMYAQLGRLHLLEELTLLPLPFPLRIFEMGRTSVENMKRLERLSVVDRANALEDRDIIWLATRLPSLRTLDLDLNTTRGSLMRDLMDINRPLNINLVDSHDPYGVRDPEMEDTDSDDYDDDSDDDDNDHDNEDAESNEFFSDDDDGSPYYSPGEEPYQPAHIYDSDDDGANMYPAATPSSSSDGYEYYSDDDGDDDDDDDGNTGGPFWGYRNPVYPNSDSSEDDHSDSDQLSDDDSDSQEDSEEDSDDDSESGGSSGGEDDDDDDDDDDDNNGKNHSELSSEAEYSIGEGRDDGSEVESGDGSDVASEAASSDDDQSHYGEEEYSDHTVSDDGGGGDSEADSAEEDYDEEEEEVEEHYSNASGETPQDSDDQEEVDDDDDSDNGQYDDDDDSYNGQYDDYDDDDGHDDQDSHGGYSSDY